MEIKASSFFATLGHQRRLDVFRLLMRRYPDAVPASEIAASLDIKSSALPVYLNTLVTAVMISQFRQGT
jgi:protein-tyrosine-phosphatase